jgi:hypothetical protein
MSKELIIGCTMMAAPFVVIFVVVVRARGWRESILYLAIVVGGVSFLGCASWFVTTGIEKLYAEEEVCRTVSQ